MKSNLIDFLSKGEENAITTRELSILLNWDIRAVTRYISVLRCNGDVICSSEKGYYLPSCIDDVKKFYRQMTSRQKEIEKAKKSARVYIEKNGGVIYE